MSAGRQEWSPALINVVGLFVLLFALGGSSRADIWSLPFLRPLAVLSLFYGLWALRRDDVVRHRWLFILTGAMLALVIIHLIPLPPALWTALPGRELIVAIDAAAGMTGTWRPISMASTFTWNALFALAVPVAILVNGARLSDNEHNIVMATIVAGGAATVLLGALQAAGGGIAALYLYPRSNIGVPLGLFANQNHQAFFLAALLPILGLLATWPKRSASLSAVVHAAAIAGVTVIIAFVIVLTSRAGLVLGILGLMCFTYFTVLSRWRGRGGSVNRGVVFAVVGLLLFVMVGYALMAGNAQSIDRALASDDRGEFRYILWPIIADALSQFMPMGSGIGTYERIFRIIEPDGILRPTYSNHAHNDWLEVALTAGAPGIFLLATSIVAFAVAVWRVCRLDAGRARDTGVAGLVIIMMCGIGSVVDYPLRTPIISALFAQACIWVALSINLSINKVWDQDEPSSIEMNGQGRARR